MAMDDTRGIFGAEARSEQLKLMRAALLAPRWLTMADARWIFLLATRFAQPLSQRAKLAATKNPDSYSAKYLVVVSTAPLGFPPILAVEAAAPKLH